MIPAPSHPFDAPLAMKAGRGVEGPSGDLWCVECAPLSIYYLGAGTRLPKGWRMLTRALNRSHRCCRCDVGLSRR